MRIVNDLTAERSDNGVFWDGSRGFVYGQGWKAWAKDFAPGTRIRVTVEVVPPCGDGEYDAGDSTPPRVDDEGNATEMRGWLDPHPDVQGGEGANS